MAFYVGQKVECIDNSNSVPGLPCPPLKTPLTVSYVYLHWSGEEAIDLVEVPNPAGRGFDRGYNAFYFRPIVERKTDISVFTKMLDRENKRMVVETLV